MNIDNINFTAFLRVAEAGSFNKAADSLYITSTALIKQINLLESDLGIRLFNRSHRGLTLTGAGESLYRDARYIVTYCMESLERAKAAMMEEGRIIRFGTSPIMPAQMLMDLWPKIHERCSDINFRLVPFENTQENAREILKTLGQNIDIVTGFVDELLMEQRGCRGLVIKKEPLCCAVSIYDPLAAKERLTPADLYGRTLMMMHRGWCRHMDELRDDLAANHPEIRLEDFDLYNVEIFNRSEQQGNILTVIQSWSIVHPMMKVIPVDWDHFMPVGILYSPDPSEVVRRFLSAAEGVLASLGY